MELRYQQDGQNDSTQVFLQEDKNPREIFLGRITQYEKDNRIFWGVLNPNYRYATDEYFMADDFDTKEKAGFFLYQKHSGNS